MNNKINIAIVGFGNIGSYFYKNLKKNSKAIGSKTGKFPVVKYISVKNIKKKRKVSIPKSILVKNPINLVHRKDVDIIIELVGGAEGIAKKLVFNAFKNRIHVITAIKSLISKHGDALGNLAE